MIHGIFLQDSGGVTLGEYHRTLGDAVPRIVFDEVAPPQTNELILISASVEKSPDSVRLTAERGEDGDTVLLFVASGNSNQIVPFTNDKTFFRHAAMKRHSGTPTAVLKGLRRQKISGYEFEIELAIFAMAKGDRIRVKPAGAPASEARVISYNGSGNFNVTKVVAAEVLPMPADPSEVEVPISV